MAGRSSVEYLQKLEIRTIGDLAQMNPELLEIHLKSHGRKLWEFANGMDNSPVEPVRQEAKGIGNSTTLPRDARTQEEAAAVLEDLAGSVGRRLRKAGQKAGMLSVEIKYHTFESVSHQRQLEKPTNQDQEIYQAARDLFLELWNQEPIRLLGIRSSKLTEEGEPEQLSIFDIRFEADPKKEKKEKINTALEQIRKKYGKDIVTKGPHS